MSDTADQHSEHGLLDVDMGMDTLFDMSAPQPNYKTLIEQGGFVEPMEGFALSFDRAITEHVLRHHEIFSSVVEMNLGTSAR